jgi:hypothetical protein
MIQYRCRFLAKIGSDDLISVSVGPLSIGFSKKTNSGGLRDHTVSIFKASLSR